MQPFGGCLAHIGGKSRPMSGQKFSFIHGLLSVIKYGKYRMVLAINVDAFYLLSCVLWNTVVKCCVGALLGIGTREINAGIGIPHT